MGLLANDVYMNKYVLDDELEREYKKIKRDLESGKLQMNSEFWFHNEKGGCSHKDPFTPADVLKEHDRRIKDKSKGLMEF